MKKWMIMASLVLAAGTLTACGDDGGSDNPPTGDATDGDGDGETTVATCWEQDPSKPAGIGREVEGESNDGDMLCDSAEANLEYNGVACDTVADCDGDGINDDAEVLFLTPEVGGLGYATSPINPDTDGAGGNDLEDIQNGLDPTTPLDDIDVSQNTELYDGPAYSYVSSIKLAGSDCCFTNLNDDPGIDNDLSSLLSQAGSLIANFADIDLSLEGVNGLVGGLVDAGGLALVIRHENVPDDIAGGTSASVESSFLLADIVVDEGGEACTSDAACTGGPADSAAFCNIAAGETEGTCVYLTASKADRLAGEGEYPLTAVIGGDNPVKLDAIIAENGFLVNAGDFLLSLNLASLGIDGVEDLGLPAEIDLLISKTQMLGKVEYQNGSIPADDSARGVKSDGDIKLGGGIGIVQVTDLLNDVLAGCYPEGTADLLTVEKDDTLGRVVLACDPNTRTADFTSSEGLCGTLSGEGSDLDIIGLVCDQLDNLIGKRLSVDTDGDGAKDGLAVGLLIGLSGASNSYDAMPAE